MFSASIRILLDYFMLTLCRIYQACQRIQTVRSSRPFPSQLATEFRWAIILHSYYRRNRYYYPLKNILPWHRCSFQYLVMYASATIASSMGLRALLSMFISSRIYCFQKSVQHASNSSKAALMMAFSVRISSPCTKLSTLVQNKRNMRSTLQKFYISLSPLRRTSQENSNFSPLTHKQGNPS